MSDALNTNIKTLFAACHIMVVLKPLCFCRSGDTHIPRGKPSFLVHFVSYVRNASNSSELAELLSHFIFILAVVYTTLRSLLDDCSSIQFINKSEN